MPSRHSTKKQKNAKKKTVLQVAELLLVRGLAQVVRHRSDDERSQHYESLMNAEASGMSSRKGMHNKSKDPPVHYYNDVSLPSTSANQAKQYLPFFQRGKQKGVVEFVLSGARLKVRAWLCVNCAVYLWLCKFLCIRCGVISCCPLSFVSACFCANCTMYLWLCRYFHILCGICPLSFVSACLCANCAVYLWLCRLSAFFVE